MPHLTQVVDEIAIIRSDGDRRDQPRAGADFHEHRLEQFGRPSMGAWVTYGLGSEIAGFAGVRRTASGRGAQRRHSNWGCGFLPTIYQGVPFRQCRRPDPLAFQPGGDRRGDAARHARRAEGSTSISSRGRRPGDRHADQLVRDGLPDADERAGIDGPLRRVEARRLAMYGASPGRPRYANNCLLARRLDRARRALRAAFPRGLGSS